MRRERQVLFWLCALALVLVFIALLKGMLLPFVAGIVIAFFLNPLVERLGTLGMSRIVASALIVAGGTVLLAGLFVFILPVLADQSRELAASLPAALETLRTSAEAWARESLGPHFEDSVTRAAAALNENWAGLAGWAAASLWSSGAAIFNLVSLLLVTPLVVFYLLIDWDPLLRKVDGWLPREHASQIRALASDMHDAVAAFIRGQGTVCLLLGVFYAVTLTLVGLKYGLVIGLGTGLLSFVPFVGWSLGLIVALGSAIVQYWPEMLPIAIVAGVFVVGMAIDAAVLGPKIVGSKIGLHPVWLIFALFAFSYLFGFVGMLVAVPVAAAIGVLVRFALEAYLESSLYKGEVKS